jgi:hypothetical protein
MDSEALFVRSAKSPNVSHSAARVDCVHDVAKLPMRNLPPVLQIA